MSLLAMLDLVRSRRQRPQRQLRSQRQALNARRVVTLNCGMGRDSVTMLLLLIEGSLVVQGAKRGPRDIDAVVFSDTGAEWEHTYEVVPRLRALCEQHGIRLIVLEKPPEQAWRPHASGQRKRAWLEAEQPMSITQRAGRGGYHLRPPILADLQSRATVVSMGKGDCTDNHKIAPMRKLLEDLSVERFGLDNRQWGAAVRAGEREPHLTIIGIAADESHRAQRGQGKRRGPDYVTEAYPLVEMGISKADEAPILKRWGFEFVRKSGCFMCPYQPISWYWAMREADPKRWRQVVAYEQRALARNPHMYVTGGTKRGGGKRLPELVEEWRRKNPDATVDEVLDKAYKRCGKGA